MKLTAEVLRNNKVGMFSERETIDEVLEWAREAGGNEAVTAAMMAYNTLLETLAVIEEN